MEGTSAAGGDGWGWLVGMAGGVSSGSELQGSQEEAPLPRGGSLALGFPISPESRGSDLSLRACVRNSTFPYKQQQKGGDGEAVGYWRKELTYT